MSFSKVSTVLVIVAIAFIGIGDRLLPHSIGQYSESSRASLLKLLPSIRAQNHNAKTEEAIKGLEQ